MSKLTSSCLNMNPPCTAGGEHSYFCSGARDEGLPTRSCDEERRAYAAFGRKDFEENFWLYGRDEDKRELAEKKKEEQKREREEQLAQEAAEDKERRLQEFAEGVLVVTPDGETLVDLGNVPSRLREEAAAATKKTKNKFFVGLNHKGGVKYAMFGTRIMALQVAFQRCCLRHEPNDQHKDLLSFESKHEFKEGLDMAWRDIKGTRVYSHKWSHDLFRLSKDESVDAMGQRVQVFNEIK